MRDALLFKPSPGNGPPTWLVCADDCIDFYTHPARGWFLLARQSEIEEQRTADIEAVREADEFKWSALSQRRRTRWRSRRTGSTGE